MPVELNTPNLVREHLALVHEVGTRKRGGVSEYDDILADVGGIILIRQAKSRRLDAGKADLMTMRTIHLTINSKITFRSVIGVLHTAADVLGVGDCIPDSPATEALEKLRSTWTLQKSVPYMADAADAHLQEEIMTKRGSTFCGLGFETDESPPCGRRFAGLRFQITIAYLCFVPPEQEWKNWTETAPVRTEAVLCDIVNAPAKDGVTVSKIVAMQLSRLGCTLADIVSGTSDGGGENEGRTGAHALIEDHNPLYVRRRGLEHLSWNFCSAGIAAAGQLCKDLKALGTYLSEGVTWQRLKEIATTSVERGGPFHSKHTCVLTVNSELSAILWLRLSSLLLSVC